MYKIIFTLFLAMLVSCATTPAPAPAPAPTTALNPLKINIEASQSALGFSAVVQFDPKLHQFTKLEKGKGVLGAVKETSPGQLKVSLISSTSIQNTWGSLEFKSLQATNQAPQIQPIEIVTPDRKVIKLNNNSRPQVAVRTAKHLTFEAWFVRLPLGDIDQSGHVNITDAINALLIDVGTLVPTNFQIYISDLYSDGLVNLADAVWILQKAINPNLPAQPVIHPAYHAVDLAGGEVWTVLIGNAGNLALPEISLTTAQGVTTELVSANAQHAMYRFTLDQAAISNRILVEFEGYSPIPLVYTIVDKIAPEIQFNSGSLVQTVNSSRQITFDFSVTDNHEVEQIFIFDGSQLLQNFPINTSYTYIFNTNPHKNGVHPFRIQAQDKAGNKATLPLLITVDIQAIIVHQTNCYGMAIGQTCQLHLRKTGSGLDWKGFGFDLDIPGFQLTSVSSQEGCTTDYATLASYSYRIGTICDAAGDSNADLMVLNLTRTTLGESTFEVQNAILASDTVPSTTVIVEGDSMTIQ